MIRKILRAENQSDLTHKKYINSYVPIWEYYINVIQKPLMIWKFLVCVTIFGHFRQFSIFSMWVRPLCFSTFHFSLLVIVKLHVYIMADTD